MQTSEDKLWISVKIILKKMVYHEVSSRYDPVTAVVVIMYI
jgi:hypothetical protein